MSCKPQAAAIFAMSVAPRGKLSNYPEPFAARMAGREKRALGDAFQLSAFGVNLTCLAPGAQSALLHRHTLQEEFIYILSGDPTLVTDVGEEALHPGMCAGFTPNGTAHCLLNKTNQEVVYLEVGTRVAGDSATYPADDLQASDAGNGRWTFSHKDGTPYPSGSPENK